MVYTTRNDFGSGVPFAFREPRTISIAGVAPSFSPEADLAGSEKTNSTPSPAWRATRSETATGTVGEGGTGSPGAPQPEGKKDNKRQKTGNNGDRRLWTCASRTGSVSGQARRVACQGETENGHGKLASLRAARAVL